MCTYFVEAPWTINNILPRRLIKIITKPIKTRFKGKQSEHEVKMKKKPLFLNVVFCRRSFNHIKGTLIKNNVIRG